jgi:hypothetical protein
MAGSTGKAPDTGDDFIDPSEVKVSPRGRKAVIDPKLVTALKAIPKGKVGRLRSTIGSVPAADRAKVSASIRKHWKVAFPGTDCRIDFDPATGIPQVRHKG